MVRATWKGTNYFPNRFKFSVRGLMRYTLRWKHSRERFLDRLETGNHVYKARFDA